VLLKNNDFVLFFQYNDNLEFLFTCFICISLSLSLHVTFPVNRAAFPGLGLDFWIPQPRHSAYFPINTQILTTSRCLFGCWSRLFTLLSLLIRYRNTIVRLRKHRKQPFTAPFSLPLQPAPPPPPGDRSPLYFSTAFLTSNRRVPAPPPRVLSIRWRRRPRRHMVDLPQSARRRPRRRRALSGRAPGRGRSVAAGPSPAASRTASHWASRTPLLRNGISC
jgi:hypothetical protein